VNPVWRRLKAVVLESDDWGLCAWSPDDQAHRVLTDTPAFRSPAGRLYGRSTLESAADVNRLVETLLEFRGGDGFPPVWQANTVVAAPDYARLEPPLFEVPSMPVLELPAAPSRWQRPGLWEAVRSACESGVWWPELHGFHHLPEQAWLTALRRNESDARRAFEQQSPVCEAVEAGGEFDASEPAALKREHLSRAIEIFTRLFGRAPSSFCPPDYRWDDAFEAEAERLGVTLWQGRAERARRALPRLRRLMRGLSWRASSGARFYMPARIAFEPRGNPAPPPHRAAPGDDGDDGARVRLGVADAHRRARAAWSAGRPAVVSTHRLNYAHLDPAWSDAGRGALRDLLRRLAGDGAVFLTDAEVRQIQERGWSTRAIGARGTLLRFHAEPRLPIRIPAPAGTHGVLLREGRDPSQPELAHEGGAAIARVLPGEYLLEWRSG
jgi:hypothetical protein